MKKKTLIFGASTNPARYSYLLSQRLQKAEYPLVLIGRSQGEVAGLHIQNDIEQIKAIHTVSIYLNKQNQKEYEDFILQLRPERVIFNPGAENQVFMHKLIDANIKAFEACSLVMLATGQF